MPALPKEVTEEELLDLVKGEMFGLENDGICQACGSIQGGCEPDAQNYECEAFGNGETMAASKALLSACRAMRDHLIKTGDYGSEFNNRDGYPRFMLEADAAISQAEERLDWPPVIERVHVKDTSFDVRDDPSLPPLSREG